MPSGEIVLEAKEADARSVERLGGQPRRVWKLKRTALDAVAPDDVDDGRHNDRPGVTAPGG